MIGSFFVAQQYLQRSAAAGFLAAGVGLVVLGIPGVPLHSLATIAPLVPVGLGLGMLFVPVLRAALNAIPAGSHGRVSAVLSIGRLLGAAAGAGLGGLALSGGASASATHGALLFACAACLLAGIPACPLLRPSSPGRSAGGPRRGDLDVENARSTDAQALGPLAPGHPRSSRGAER